MMEWRAISPTKADEFQSAYLDEVRDFLDGYFGGGGDGPTILHDIDRLTEKIKKCEYDRFDLYNEIKRQVYVLNFPKTDSISVWHGFKFFPQEVITNYRNTLVPAFEFAGWKEVSVVQATNMTDSAVLLLVSLTFPSSLSFS